MLYYLFDYLRQTYNMSGAGVFQYISFRSGLAVVLSLIISIVVGRYLIPMLNHYQVNDRIRNLGLKGEAEKQGTPTMGGIIIIVAILITTLLCARVNNVYVVLLIVTTLWLGLIGFVDDYIKVFKNNKKGLAARFKIIGQVGLGLIVGLTLYFHEDVKVRQPNLSYDVQVATADSESDIDVIYEDVKSSKTTIPFFKNNEFDYSTILPDMGKPYTWILYTIVVMLIITAVSNGANVTDGVDGLTAGSCAIIGVILTVLAYLSGRIDFSHYLNIMYIPNLEELVIFCASLVGACLGFLWYNAFPAQIFMGDTGSLSLGGIIAVVALAVKKELMIPFICGIFFIESVSVIMQVSFFKYTKKKYGEGQYLLRMSPLHHHYQKAGIHESKIVIRFWLLGALLAVFSLVTLKLR